jgi:hypothetical protein
LLFFLSISFTQGQEIEAIQMQFSREVQRENNTETSQGYIYYQQNKVIIKITEPIRQWMILEAGTMLIYYPDENEALRFNNTLQSNIPFLDFFIRIANEDFGLSDLGYHIDRNEFINDTLFTNWIPEEKYKESMGPVCLTLYDNRVVFSESKDPKGKTVIKIHFKNYRTYQSKYLPMKMTIYQYLDNGTIIENIVYSNPRINEPLSREISEFEIPETVYIEDIE